MGATLPAIARWVETTPEGVSWLGFFYGGNIAGAVLGSLAAGFYLLRVHDMSIATFAAVGLNVLVAAIALRHRADRAVRGGRRDRAALAEQPKGAWAIYVAIGISGMTALAAEVIWTRILSLLYGGTVYTFSLILAVFLLGLGHRQQRRLGAGAQHGAAAPGAGLGADAARRRDRLGGLHAHAVAAVLADRSVDVEQPLVHLPARSRALAVGDAAGRDPLGRQLPAGARLGRQRPPGSGAGWSAASTPPTPSARSSARSAASLLLVVWLGSQRAQQLLIVLSVMSSLLALDAASAEAPKPAPARGRMRLGGTLLIVGAAMLAAWLARNVGAVPAILVAYGRYAASRIGQADVIYMGEGWNASVAVTRLSNGVLNYHNAGKVQASSEPQDMRLQRMLGHMTTLIPHGSEARAGDRLRRRASPPAPSRSSRGSSR